MIRTFSVFMWVFYNTESRKVSDPGSLILDLTQHIENGYEEKKITRILFIHLTAAYDTVNHNLLISKIKKS